MLSQFLSDVGINLGVPAQHSLLLSMFSFSVSLVIVYAGRTVPFFYSRSHHMFAIQAMHTRPTSRLGGITIYGVLVLSLAFVPVGIWHHYAFIIFSAGLLFVAGVIEDLDLGLSPLTRLLSACIASLMLILMLGDWLPRIGIPGFDDVMAVWIIGIPLTVLITAGIANGFNLIDGVNGLSATTAIVTATCLGVIADQAGYSEMVSVTAMIAAGIFGFLLLNFPFGLIFLGDGGAYTLGFVLSWLGIEILLFSSDISPWAILLTFFWPLADTALAIYRRWIRNCATMEPDRLHYHQLVVRALKMYFIRRDHAHIANPLTTVILAPFVIAPPVVGVLFSTDLMISFLAVVAFTLLFFGSYFAAFPLLRYLKRISFIPL